MTSLAKSAKRPRDWDDCAGSSLSRPQPTIHSYFNKTVKSRNQSLPVLRRPRNSGNMAMVSPATSNDCSSSSSESESSSRHSISTSSQSSTVPSKSTTTEGARYGDSAATKNDEHSDRRCNTSQDGTIATSGSRPNNSCNNKPAKKQKMQQLYLDLGQKNFGKQTVCQTCGMLYVHGLAEDAKEHEKICKDFRDGVPFHMKLQSCRVVAQYPSSFGGTTTTKHHHHQSNFSSTSSTNSNNNSPEQQDACIVEIRASDSYALRHKVQQAMVIVDKELGYVEEDEESMMDGGIVDDNRRRQSSNNKVVSPKTVFLYIQKKRILGLASVEIVKQGFRLMLLGDEEDGQRHQRSMQPSPAKIGIHKVWVHSSVRKQNIATRLIDAARARMVFGTAVAPQYVAFSSPTEAGARFALGYLRHHHHYRRCTSTSNDNTKEQEEESNEPAVLVYDLPL